MQGLNGETTKVVGSGTVLWRIEDQVGIVDNIITNAYYVPTANIGLFSPQSYLKEQHQKQNNHCRLMLHGNGICLTTSRGTTLSFPIQSSNNLPIMLTERAIRGKNSSSFKANHTRHKNRFENLSKFLCSTTFDTFNRESLFNNLTSQHAPSSLDDSRFVLRRANWNLTEAQQELLLWHQRLGHVNMHHVQTLLAKQKTEDDKRVIQPSNHKSSHCQTPLCEACQYAKQKRRNPPSKVTHPAPENEGALSRDILIPGERVSVDLYQSSTKGRLPHTFGKELKDLQYTGGALFVDHATRLVHHSHQFTTTAAETIRSKHHFEQFCDAFGVKVREYIGDNNPFHSTDWKTDCENQFQQTGLSGVGAHHQNHAERSIQTIFNMARAMLLHFALHWPQAANTNLWPFAIDHAVYIWNLLPDAKNRLSPLEHFTRTKHPNHHHLQRLHVFGCPVYVLNPKLQDGKKLPKWDRRSRRGIYLGVSRLHSSTVHLVLNPDTGKISPQYHVVFDDSFSTIFSDGAFTHDVWTSLVTSSLDRHPDAATAIDTIPFQPDLPLRSPRSERELTTDSLSPTTDSRSPTVRFSDKPSPLSRPSLPSSPEGALPRPEGVPPPPEGEQQSSPPIITKSPTPILRRSTRLIKPTEPRRSTRVRKPIEKMTLLRRSNFPRPKGSSQVYYPYGERAPRVSRELLDQQYLASLNWDNLLGLLQNIKGTLGAFASEHRKNSLYNSLVEYLNPATFITMANKEDNPTFKEVMTSPDKKGFIRAMEIEIETLNELQVYDLVPRPQGQKVISGVWAFKRKRYPDGSIRKLKARYCARGFEQQQGGVDYFETFAPVVMWLTVRLLLIMSILMRLETKQIDYTAAFVHAPIDCTVFVECPQGFEVPGKVWRLKKSLYGLAQSPRNFFLHTKQQLEGKLGFTQSDADPCLFISAEVICLIYVDDALLFYKNEEAVNKMTRKMTDADIQFREEEDVAGFLGVHIDRKDDGTIHLTQKGLAERIVTALGLDDPSIKPVDTPATAYLPMDEDGDPPQLAFNYASVVGQLNYLAGHSRCDIAFATSQVARYLHKTKRSHELALIRIGRYLKGTLDRGLILQPEAIDKLKVDLYVDAAFASGWGSELCTNPDSVKSRTGYIIEIANCPVMWVSKLQTSIATSTMEAEYTALSMALRAFIPLQAIIRSVIAGLQYTQPTEVTLQATVHEDNQGALILANLEPGRTTIRSKFYALKLHWFRSWTMDNDIKIKFIETDRQKADFLTKALSTGPFQSNRGLSMGW